MKSPSIHFAVKKDMLDEAERYASNMGLNISEYMRYALKQQLERQKRLEKMEKQLDQ